jgi:hypothetical protein
MNDIDNRQKELVELAWLDESEPYEVDHTGIYLDPNSGKFVLLTASGCSCWDGEYNEEEYDTLEDLEKSLNLDEDKRRWNPSLQGAKDLMKEARATLAAKDGGR